MQEFFALLPLCLDAIILVEQLGKELFLVEFTDQSVLYNLLTMVDEEMHDSLGDLVGYGLADNIKVGRNQPPDQFCFQQFTVGEGGLGIVIQLDTNESAGWQ